MTHSTPDPSTSPCVAPVIGKRARLRNGQETPKMGANRDPESPYCFKAYVPGCGSLTWMDTGQFDRRCSGHPFDIIAIVVEAGPLGFSLHYDEPKPIGDGVADDVPQPEPDVAPITGYRIGEAFFSVEDGLIMIRDGSTDTAALTPAEARALLQVLPGLIKIAEGV